MGLGRGFQRGLGPSQPTRCEECSSRFPSSRDCITTAGAMCEPGVPQTTSDGVLGQHSPGASGHRLSGSCFGRDHTGSMEDSMPIESPARITPLGDAIRSIWHYLTTRRLQRVEGYRSGSFAKKPHLWLLGRHCAPTGQIRRTNVWREWRKPGSLFQILGFAEPARVVTTRHCIMTDVDFGFGFLIVQRTS